MTLSQAHANGAVEADKLCQDCLILAVQATRQAEEARAINDLHMASRYEKNAADWHDAAEKHAERAEWYRQRVKLFALPLTYPKIEARLEAAE
jgi:hypothetical protein